jgi:hypothetical protein
MRGRQSRSNSAPDVLLDSRDTRERLRPCAPHAEICFIEDGYHFLPDQSSRVMDFLTRRMSLPEMDA